MSVNPEVEKLIEWLGPEGAKAGLLGSRLQLKELVALAKERKLHLSPKPTREEVSNELAFSHTRKVELSIEQFLKMGQDEIIKYLKKVKPSRVEILEMLSGLGVHVSSDAAKSLYAFAAREISEMGMYQRVARGKSKPSDT